MGGDVDLDGLKALIQREQTKAYSAVETGMMTLSNDWAGCQTTGGSASTMTVYPRLQDCGYQWWPSTTYVMRDARPIKLTLSEVERLRKAVKADEALKAILLKFTGQIEVIVDFK